MRIAATCDGAMTVAEQLVDVVEALARRALLVVREVAVDGREGREVDARQERLVADPVVQVGARDARRADRPPVERSPERDDRGPAGDPPRELERPVDRLRAGVEEQDRVERVRQRVREHPRQRHRRLGEPDRVDGTDQAVDLGVDGRSHPRMRVPERGNRDPVGEVEVLAPRGVHEAVADPVRPAPVHVPAEDRRHVGLGEGGEVERVGVAADGVHRPSIGSGQAAPPGAARALAARARR